MRKNGKNECEIIEIIWEKNVFLFAIIIVIIIGTNSKKLRKKINQIEIILVSLINAIT